MEHQTNKTGLIGAKSVVLGSLVRFVGWADNQERAEEPDLNQKGTVIDLERDEGGTVWLSVTYRLPGQPSRVFLHSLDEVSLVTLAPVERNSHDPIRCFA